MLLVCSLCRVLRRGVSFLCWRLCLSSLESARFCHCWEVPSSLSSAANLLLWWPARCWAISVSRNWWEVRWEIQAGLYWGSCCSGGGEQVTGALLAPRGGVWAGSLNGWGRWQVQGSGQRGVLGGLPTRFLVLCAGGVSRTLPLLLTPWKWQLGF